MSSSKKILVFCPNDAVTGGPDALHQMVYYLNHIGYNANIVYYAFSKKHFFAIPEAYKTYVSEYMTEKNFVDSPDNIVVLPERSVDKLKFVKNGKVFVWWLSVDNNTNRSSLLWKFFFFVTLPARIVKNWDYYRKHFSEAIVKTLQMKKYVFKTEQENVEHICASFYAYDFVSKRSSCKTSLCIEPISKFFLDKYNELKKDLELLQRFDGILYNPRKCGCFVDKLAKLAPDLNFIPLKGMNQDELVEMYRKSKLYIDFGPFPGAERIPKEAVLFGCCVLTGRNGASDYYGDVPIPDKYKFADYMNQMDLIIEKIRYVLKNYEKVLPDFDEYRKTVLMLEENFKNSLRECLEND